MKVLSPTEILAAIDLPAEIQALPGVYVVGGAVRDALLRRRSVDLDLMVEGPLTPVVAALGGELNERFGTATCAVDGRRVDVARARTETYPAPGALPVVAPATAVEDLTRRDFTVNAIAVAEDELLAPAGALEDLQASRLRVLHDRSFSDDPTRLFRLARYAARLGFTVEPGTASLAADAVKGGALRTLSGARIGQELKLLAAEDDPAAAFACLHSLGVDQALAPGFGVTDPSLIQRTLLLLPDDGRKDLAVLGAALLGVEDAEFVASLGYPAPERDLLELCRTRAEKLSYYLEMAGPPSEIDGVIGKNPVELVALAGAIHPAGAVREWFAELRDQQVSISGEDLIAAGVAPGPAIGAGLAAARAALLDCEADTREEQLAVALEAAAASG